MDSQNQTTIDIEILLNVLNKMFVEKITRADYETKKLYGWVCDSIQLITGFAETINGEKLPFKVVLKTQKKVSPPHDNDWTREYYFYSSDFYKIFDEKIGMPKCYHSEFSEEKYILWLEYIDGITKDGFTTDDLEYVSEKLGAFHGKIYTQSELTKNLHFLSLSNYVEKKIWSWHKSPEYDYLRSESFDVPEHLKHMLIEIDDNKERILEKIKNLPIVLYHADFHPGNVFLRDGKVILFDWGHNAGFGYLGEDIANLISDNNNFDLWVEYYRRFIPAYLRGFSEYVDISKISGIENFYTHIKEMIILSYGYDMVKSYMSAKNQDEKDTEVLALQKIYEMGDIQDITE